MPVLLASADEWLACVAPQARAKPSTYNFDQVFDGSATQAQVFEHVKPLADMVLSGVNATVMAYGCVSTVGRWTCAHHRLLTVPRPRVCMAAALRAPAKRTR